MPSLYKMSKLDEYEQVARRVEIKENTLPFYALIFFTFIVYITPQSYFPFLQSLHLAKASALFAVLIYVHNALRKRQYLFELDIEPRLLLIIVIFAILSIPFSKWPGGSFKTLTNLYLKVIIIFLLIANVLISVTRIKTMLWSIIFFCGFDAIVGIKDFLAGRFSLGRIEGAPSPITSNPNDLALTLVLSLPFALSFFLLYQNKLKKLVCAAYVFLATSGIICTFSRGGLIVLITIYGIFFLKMAKKSGIKAFVPAIVLIVIFISLLPRGYTDRMSTIFDFSKDTSGSAQLRMATTIQGFELMLENPFLGVGLGMNELALTEKGLLWERIHNVYLEIGVELGISALLIFIILLYKLIKNMRLIQKDSVIFEGKQEIILLSQAIEISLIGFAVAAVFHPVAYHFYFYYIAGFAVAVKRMYNDLNSIQQSSS